ncbi:MAG TPA: hypothetical protein VHG28_05730 [Longimicrobiaceae bacterium]|nr:hypothetical protein [Longimicrobiaceae bacterium]
MVASVRSVFRGLVPVLLTLLAGSCAPAAPPGSPSPDGHDHTPEEVAALVSGTPSEVAAAAVARCGRRSAARKQGCYEPVLLGVLHTQGVRPAMQALDSVVARDRDVRRDAHQYAHAIGIAAYAGPQEVEKTFAGCTPEHQSGCYHGVIQAHFVDALRRGGEITAETVNSLCRAYQGPAGDRWLEFQCAHGMGHGVVMFRGHDLPVALRDCDLLESPFQRETCYHGAFMENVVNAVAPHHAAASLLRGEGRAAGHGGGDAHAHHHGGGADTSATRFRALDPEDPLYPCTVMEERYLAACYSMQTSVILHHNRYDVAAAARACERVPARWRTTCFVSLGRDISGISARSRPEAIRRCSLVESPTDQSWCHVGVATNMLNVTARAEDGLAYCREVTGEENKTRCYRAIGEQLLVLEDGIEGREAACRGAEPEHVEACRRGARLAER